MNAAQATNPVTAPTMLPERIARPLCYGIGLGVSLCYIAVLFTYKIDAPFMDDFAECLDWAVRYMQAPQAHERFHLIFEQYLEHRPVFNKLVYLSSIYLSGAISFYWIGIVAALALFVPLAFIVHFTPRDYHPYALATASLCVLNLQFSEALMVTNGFCTLLIFAMVLLFLRSLFLHQVVRATLLAVLAQYTQGNGILVFVIGSGFLLVRHKDFTHRQLLFWCVAMVFTLWSYFHGLKPDNWPAFMAERIYRGSLLEHVLLDFDMIVLFLVSIMGNIFGFLSEPARGVAGACLLGFSLLACRDLLRDKRYFILCYMAFLYASVAASALVRSKTDYLYLAFMSHYSFYASQILAISLVCTLSRLRDRHSQSFIALQLAVILALLPFSAWSCYTNLRWMADVHNGTVRVFTTWVEKGGALGMGGWGFVPKIEPVMVQARELGIYDYREFVKHAWLVPKPGEARP